MPILFVQLIDLLICWTSRDPFGDDALDIPVFDLANNVRWESFQLVNDFLFKGSMPGYLHLTSEEFSESLKELSDSNAGKVA